MINRFLEDVKTTGFPRIQSEDSNNLHNSSADLFIFYKNCMSQCLQLFTNSGLLCKLAVTFQKYLREYSNRVLSSSLPKLTTFSSSSYSSISGAATSLIQNFQIQNMLKEASQNSSSGSLSSGGLLDSTKKLNENEVCRICSILCTAEYCLETTQQLEDKLKEKVSISSDSMNKSSQQDLNAKKINFTNERDVFGK